MNVLVEPNLSPRLPLWSDVRQIIGSYLRNLPPAMTIFQVGNNRHLEDRRGC
jgi:hypothetical protein